MKRTLSRRARIRIVSYAAGAVLIAAGIFGVQQARIAALDRYISNSNQHAFFELTTAMSGIQTSLQKGIYATSPTVLSAICFDLFGKATQAQMALGEIPYSHVDLEKTSDYVARVGDYALAISQLAATQEGLDDEIKENLRSLLDIASELSNSLITLQGEIDEGIMTLEDLETAKARLSKDEEDVNISSDGVQEVETEFPELPTLIYDGPFSAHLDQQTSLFLEGKSECTEAEALENIQGMTGMHLQGLESAGTGEGHLPTYRFSGQDGDGEIYIEVTRVGGVLLNYSYYSATSEAVYAPEDCVKFALQFLTDNGFDSMEESYWTAYDGTVAINFAYRQGDVTCYPDLIKVTVARDTGEIIGFESTGYVMSHRERSIDAPAVTADDARGHVSADLTIVSEGLAIIPSAGQEERLCFEFICENEGGQHYIIYVNALTGSQEKILILLEDESGTLTL